MAGMPFDARRPIRVLHLEDNPRDAEIIEHKLAIEGVPCSITVVESADRFHTELARHTFDLVLCDYNVPGYDGLRALQRAKELRPESPVIIISGSVGEDEAVRCLHSGATDYLLKQHLERLGSAVRRAIQEAEERRSRAEAEDALQQRERRLSSIYEAVADTLFYIEVEKDGGYRYTSVNPAFLSTSGLEYDQVVGRRVEEVLPPSSLSTALEHFEAAIRERRIVRWEDTTEYPKGQVIGEVSVAPVFDAAGVCTHLVGSLHDVTERRLLESQLRQAQKMESVGQLAGGIAHDFNNLLTIINGVSELALSHMEQGGRQLQDDLIEIRRAGERAAALTGQLLAFSRKQILKPQIIDLNATVAEMGSMLRRLLGEHITLTIAPIELPARVKADRGQLEQVIANLAVNARDAMPSGGTLSIETRLVKITPAIVQQRGLDVSPGPYVSLAISDTGTGMDDATRRHLFEPFFTTKEPGQGTGLGLSTVYGIVKQSGGFVSVESELGRGSCFTVVLPQVMEKTAEAAPPPVKTENVRSSETVLVVEDVAALRRLISRMLESAGFTVLTAASGEEALNVLERSGRTVDMLLTDIVMPGMSGRDLAGRLALTHPQIAVLFMSGYTDDVVVRHGLDGVARRLITKPFAAGELIRAVRDVLDSPPQPR